MTDNKGDLISREALKKAIKSYADDQYAENEYLGEYTIMKIIDNAPTVEPCYQTISCLDCKNYDKANYYCPRFCEVIREIAKENQRPQGEWIWITEYDGFVHSKCSNCNQFNDWGDVPFCPWCGAKMSKQDESI